MFGLSCDRRSYARSLQLQCDGARQKIAKEIFFKILLPAAATSLSRLPAFYDCSGGNSRPSRLSGVGGGNFLANIRLFFLAREHALARLRLSRNTKPRSIMLNSAKPRRFVWPIAFIIAALITATTIGFIFWRLESWPLRTARQSSAELERLGGDLRAAFIDIAHLQPRITINNRVYMEQTTAMSELVVLARRIEVEHELLHTWVGSSKRVKLHGTFLAKAGFDLQQGFAIDIRPTEIIVQVPHAQILGVEQQQVDVLAFENGLWNRISAQDVQSELSVLPQLALEKAAESGLPAEAERTLQRQIAERIQTPQPLHLLFKAAPEKQ